MKGNEPTTKMEGEEDTSHLDTPSPNRKLDTKQCCFLCFKKVPDFKTEWDHGNSNEDDEDVEFGVITKREPVSLESLLKYLQFSNDTKEGGGSEVSENGSNYGASLINSEGEKIEVDLCDLCDDLIQVFSKSFSRLGEIQLEEKGQMEVNYWLGRIHNQISENAMPVTAKKNEPPHKRRKGKKRMKKMPIATSSDPEETFVENLREEIAKRSLEMNTTKQLQIQLIRLRPEEIPPPRSRSPPDLVKNETSDDDDSISSKGGKEDDDGSDWAPPRDYSSHSTRRRRRSPSLSMSTASSSSISAVSMSESELSASSSSSATSCPIKSKKEMKRTEDVEVGPRKASPGKIYYRKSEDGTYDCSECSKTFQTPLKARFHFQKHHLGRRKNGKGQGPSNMKGGMGMYIYEWMKDKYTCTECSTKNGSREAAIRHFLSVHQSSNPDDKSKGSSTKRSKRFACKRCKKSFDVNAMLQRHIVVAHEMGEGNTKNDLNRDRRSSSGDEEESQQENESGREVKVKAEPEEMEDAEDEDKKNSNHSEEEEESNDAMPIVEALVTKEESVSESDDD